EGAFAQLKLWQSVSIAVVFFISTSISLQTMVVTMLVALCISLAAFLFLTLKFMSLKFALISYMVPNVHK
ncbi:hypothetical protein MIMGU_mgv1a0198712mg, partial [Erythranthe guttata]